MSNTSGNNGNNTSGNFGSQSSGDGMMNASMMVGGLISGAFKNATRAKAQSADYRLQAAQTRAQANLDRSNAYASAYNSEIESKNATWATLRSMGDTARNGMNEVNSLAASNATSGFGSTSGSKLSTQETLLNIVNEQLANMSAQNAARDSTMRQQAMITRHDADTAYALASNQADYFDKMESIKKKEASGMLGGGLGDAAVTATIAALCLL